MCRDSGAGRLLALTKHRLTRQVRRSHTLPANRHTPVVTPVGARTPQTGYTASDMGALRRARLAFLSVSWLLLVLHLAGCDCSSHFRSPDPGRDCPHDRAHHDTSPAPWSCVQCQACARACPVEDSTDAAQVAPDVAVGGEMPLAPPPPTELHFCFREPPRGGRQQNFVSCLDNAPNAPPAVGG